ncbi:MAG: hypothetical protein EHM81_14085, partial [Chloroflexi bacterium]
MTKNETWTRISRMYADLLLWKIHVSLRKPRPNFPRKFRDVGILIWLVSLTLGCSVRPVTISPTPFLVHPSSTPLPTATPAPSLPPTNTPTATSTPSPTPGYAPVIRFPTWALIHDLAWSPDGEHIAISAGTDVFLYDRAARLEQTFPVGVWAERVAFHPSQPVLAAAVKDGSIRFWDTVTGAETCRFPAHLKGANSLAFQPGGELLASTGNDIISHLWDIASVLYGG